MIELESVYTYHELFYIMEELHHRFSDITEFRIAGRSCDDRDIPLLKIGHGSRTLFCTAGVHGRESINPPVLLKMAEDYCESFIGKTAFHGYLVSDLLTNYSICILPLLNPDGYEIATAGYDSLRNPALRQQAKASKIPSEEWKYNGRGIDINRNFPCRSYRPVHRSDYPGSETETRLLQKMFHKYPSVAYLDFHSRSNLIYFYRNAMSSAYNRQQEKLAVQLQAISGYQLGTKAEELETISSGGNTVQYYSETYGMPAITIETVPEEATFPLNVSWQQSVYHEVRLLPLEILVMARSIRRYDLAAR